jgi:hypothetical protein
MISCGVDRLFNALSRFLLEGHRVAQIWGNWEAVQGCGWCGLGGPRPYREDRPSYYGPPAQSTLVAYHVDLYLG